MQDQTCRVPHERQRIGLEGWLKDGKFSVSLKIPKLFAQVLEEARAAWLPDRRRTTLLGTSIGGVIAVLAGFLSGIIPRIEEWSYDLPFAFRNPVPVDGVEIVYKDDETFRQPGFRSTREWDRTWDARLIARATQDGARAIVFDIIYDEKSINPRADADLARYAAWSQRVVFAADLNEFIDPSGRLQRVPALPISPLSTNTIGLVKFVPSSDYMVRQHLIGTEQYGSLAWAAAQKLGAAATQHPEARGVLRWVNFYGPGGSIPNVSYFRAADTNLLPSGYFKDKVVFVGSKMSVDDPGAEKDQFRGPLTWLDRRFHPGVEVHAIQYLNLVRGDWLTQISTTGQVFIFLLLGAASGVALTLLRPLQAATAWAIGCLTVLIVANYLVNAHQLWFTWIGVEIQLAAALAWSVIFHSVRAHFEKELLKMQTRNMEVSLKAYVSEARVKQLMAQPDLIRPGVQQMHVTLLFSDIENFSKFSEGLPSDELGRLLNNYYEAALKSIHETDGTVVQLIGDAIFAIWNAPFPQPDHHWRACRSALLLAERLGEFGEAKRNMPLRTRVGIHSGLASVGNIGSKERFNYTAIGDSTNLTSRLEGLNKFLDTQLLVSVDFVKEIKDRVVCRKLGRFRFKGFGRAVEVYEILGTLESAARAVPWVKQFEEALDLYLSRSFNEAEKAFRATVASRQEIEQSHLPVEFRHVDGPSRLYLGQIELFRTKPPKPDWIGEFNMDEK